MLISFFNNKANTCAQKTSGDYISPVLFSSDADEDDDDDEVSDFLMCD